MTANANVSGGLSRRWRLTVWLGAAVVGIGCAAGAGAQTQFDRGQNVQPVFEGWEENADGSFNLVFGYLNRNYEERPHIPVGPNNQFSPGEPDRGQPTHFYPRRQSFVFKVRVPVDFGDQDLVWTLTRVGRTDTATGSLWPVWEIDENVVAHNRGLGTPEYVDNTAPRIEVVDESELTVTMPETATLKVVVSDEGSGIFAPRRRRRRGSNRRPGPNTQNVVDPRRAVEAGGLAVTWLQHRGPGVVTFTPMSPPIEAGAATTVASFSAPGTYVLRAVADDLLEPASAYVTVTVNPPASTSR